MGLTKCEVQSSSKDPPNLHLESPDQNKTPFATYVKNEPLTGEGREQLEDIQKFDGRLDPELDVKMEKTCILDDLNILNVPDLAITPSKLQSSGVVDTSTHKNRLKENALKVTWQNNLQLLKRCRQFRIRLKNLKFKTFNAGINTSNLVKPATKIIVNDSNIAVNQKVPPNVKTSIKSFNKTESYLKSLKLELEKSNLKLTALDFKRRVDEQIPVLLN